jgi:hypothetical protein
VVGTFDDGAGGSGAGTCTTNQNGRCNLSWTPLPDSLPSVSFSVDSINGSPAWTGSDQTITLLQV